MYFSDVVVRADHSAGSLDDLVSAVWAVNDQRSLSGYGCVVKALGDDVAQVCRVDTIAASSWSGQGGRKRRPSNTLRRVDRSGLKVVHTFGPHPVQPIVANPGFPMIGAVAETLGSAHTPERGVLGFAAVTEQDYPESLD